MNSSMKTKRQFLRVIPIAVGLFLIAGTHPATAQFDSRQPGYPKYSAFTDVQVIDKGPDGRPRVNVTFEGEEYRLISIHQVSMEEVFEFTEKTLMQNADHRITEDLPQIIRLMGKPIEKDTTIAIEDANGKVIYVDVTMTKANRNKIFENRIKRGEKGGTFGKKEVAPPDDLTAEQLDSDLKQFQQQLEKQFAYLKVNEVDLPGLIDAIRQRHPKGLETKTLTLELQHVMSSFIDGHSSIRGPQHRSRQALPFLIEAADFGFVAFHEDRMRFVDEDFPYIKKIDRMEVEELSTSFDTFIPALSPQNLRRQRLRMLRDIGRARQMVGLELLPTLEIELANLAGDKKTITVPIADRGSQYKRWPRDAESRILIEHNLGYLRIEKMNERAVDHINELMDSFKDTDGLIIDVRDNGGGIRLPMLELAGYLMTHEDEPRIGNVCKYRLYEKFPDDHLEEGRYVYRVDSKKFDQRQRDVIANFMKTFKPQWNPPQAEFSKWHFCVFSKPKDDPRYDYKKPVVILMNEKCFSATDIFIGAFKGWPNVTLVGQPSGGGSARSMRFELPVSKIKVRCASMASFQPDGKLYDGNGVQPDVIVTPTPEYYLDFGEDIFLNKAIELINR